MDTKLLCTKCGAEFPIEQQSYCPKCGGIITVWYSNQYLKSVSLDSSEKIGPYKYRKLLPSLTSEKNIISFGEGGTPLKKSSDIGISVGVPNLYFKDETKNPTGSFKDRSISVCTSMAMEFGCSGIVVASSGNGAASVSAYGSKAGLNTYLFVPEHTPVGKVAQAIAYGGKIIKVRGDFSKCYKAAMEMSTRKHFMNMTTTFLSPYGIEGYKIIAFEIFEQLGQVPAYVFVPVGAGPILYGIWKGFDELVQMGKAKNVPRLICAQAAGCSPISSAWIHQKGVVACSSPQTVASAICDPLLGYEQDGDITITAINKSNGAAYCLADKEMINAGRDLAVKEGMFVEVSSAASLAALYKMKQEGHIDIKKDDICVCILTGHGLKDADAYIPQDYQIPVIDNIDEL